MIHFCCVVLYIIPETFKEQEEKAKLNVDKTAIILVVLKIIEHVVSKQS